MGWNLQNRVFSMSFLTRSVFCTHANPGDAIAVVGATETSVCYPIVDGRIQAGSGRSFVGQRLRLTGARWVAKPSFVISDNYVTDGTAEGVLGVFWDSLYVGVQVHKGDSAPTNPSFTVQPNRDYLCHLGIGGSELLDYEIEGGTAFVCALAYGTGLISSSLGASAMPVWSGSKHLIQGVLTVDAVLL